MLYLQNSNKFMDIIISYNSSVGLVRPTSAKVGIITMWPNALLCMLD